MATKKTVAKKAAKKTTKKRKINGLTSRELNKITTIINDAVEPEKGRHVGIVLNWYEMEGTESISGGTAVSDVTAKELYRALQSTLEALSDAAKTPITGILISLLTDLKE